MPRLLRSLLLLVLAPAAALAQAPKPEGEPFFFTPPGFTSEGKPVTADDAGTGHVEIVVRDGATRKPTFCRIAVVGPDGNFYQPKENYLTPYALTGEWPNKGAWGNRRDKAPYRYLGRFFYSWGETTVAVPPGKLRVEVQRGYETKPQSEVVEVVQGMTRRVEITLTRTGAMGPLGYFNGDPHLHLPRTTEREEETILDLLAAEDIRYGAILGFNEPAGPYVGDMAKFWSPQQRGLGLKSSRSRSGYQIVSGQEYRSTVYGHLMLYLRDEIVFPGKSFNSDTWPVHGEVGRETQGQGGLAVHAHGGYAQEIYADAALGSVNGVELLQFGIYRGIGLSDWYHILNSGYRFPILGASDWPACRWLGDCRTYVHAAGTPTPADWLRGAAAGRSFVTTGPLLLLEVDGEKPGARLERQGKTTVTARVRVRCEVTPVAQVDLIVNGAVVRSHRIPEKRRLGDWFEVTERLDLSESSWVAARAWSTTPGGQPDAESHTNPVYVYLDGRAPYRQASLDAWVARIDGQIAAHRKRTFAEKARVLDYFQRARDLLLKVRQDGGLRADAEPARMARSMDEEARKTRLAADASKPDATDAELREFLKPVPPRSPQEQWKTFETVDGFQMQLVAAEPLVYDPVAAAFDEDGNLYVCEMRDYPFKPTDGRKPIGTVRLLRDRDGDGTYETSTVFADELLWAAGVVPWKGGVFVAAAPDIWYLKDTDGDGKADVRRKVYTGFGTDNQQAMVNNLVWGLDHRIYGATAGNGGMVRRGDDPHGPPIAVNGRDFRFDPVSEAFEAITGTVQFGNTFDDWGHRFVCSESQPLLHVLLPQQYLARNPYLPVPSAIKNLAPGPVPIYRISPVERWRQIRSSRRIAQGERSAESAGASHHVVDAAAGVTVYRGGAYPSRYYGSVFVGDGQNNLVHHRTLETDGVSFRSRRFEERTEFVRSSDIWFRPVNFVNAPDGTLWCLDMSREVLESIHIPLDVVKHLDLTSGRNNGRIYRMAPPGFEVPKPPRLSRATTAELVAALESPHGWWRDTAHRLIYERQDAAAVPLLHRLARESARPEARVVALWLLHGLRALDEASLLAGLGHPHPGVRENALRLAETQLDRAPALLDRAIALADDRDAHVRLQAAFSLGESTSPRAAEALARMAKRDAGDATMRTAVLSSVGNFADRLFLVLLADPSFAAGAGAEMLDALALVVGVRNRSEEVTRTLAAVGSVTDAARQSRLIQALGTGLKRAGARLPATDPVVARLLVQARERAADRRADEAARRQAVSLLSCGPYAAARETLVALIDPQQPQSLQAAAVRALAEYAEPAVAEILLRPWMGYSPDLRAEVVHALLSREDWTLAFLRAAEKGDASVAPVELTRRELLRKHRNEVIRALASRLFETTTASRSAVIAAYRSALVGPTDATRGEKAFEKHCLACHQVGTKGHAVGPALTSSSIRDAEAFLTHILDPNLYVPPPYVQYVVTDRKGRTFTGLIAAQTATSITLKRENGATDTILRRDVEELISSGKSLMPEGLEKTIPPAEMADLIAYLMRAVRQPVAGNPNRERDFGTLPGLVEPPAALIITLGDSITKGVRAGVRADETFAALLAARLRERKVNAEVVNVGIGGERTDGALARLDRDVLARKPRLVTIMYGTNDSYVDRGATDSRLSLAQYRENLVKLVEAVRRAGAEPVLMTEPRWAPDARNGIGENPNVRLEKYVAVCREVARERKVPLVDHFAHWTEAETKGTNLRDWTTDGCHPNPRGHREIAEQLLPVVLERLAATGQ